MPPDVPDATDSWPEPEWKPLLTAARLDATTLVAAVPLWPPPVATDLRRAWTSGDRRIEAARVPRARRLVRRRSALAVRS